MEPICGVPAETLREVARMYARSRASIVFWGMASPACPWHRQCALPDRAGLDHGQVGRPARLHPLRGQTTCRASDAA